MPEDCNLIGLWDCTHSTIMALTKALLLFGVVAAAAATSAPWPVSIPICAEECPVTEMSKFKYEIDKTYVYRYSGKSKIEMTGVEGGVTETDWQKNVLLSWLSPCEMAITFQGVTIDGSAPEDSGAANFLEKYPLVVALSDGRVQRVCSHPRDDPWAINMKKGVATAFQNLLPTLMPLSGGVNYTETDVLGKCPTTYQVEKEGDKVTVRKEKDHRWCMDRYPTPDRLPKGLLKAPVPIERSFSSCEQEIHNGIYSSIKCKDFSYIRPSVGAYKHIEGTQESTLQFVSENDEAPESLSTIHGEYEYGSLIYDHEPLNKDASLVPLVEQKLKELCEMTKESIAHEAATMVAEIVQLLKHVPDERIPQILEKIRKGEVCEMSSRLENLFLDSIAFTHMSGSVKVMVDELLKGEKSARTRLYSSALSKTHHPTPKSIKEMEKLFKSEDYLPSAQLSASTAINNYCRQYPDCHRTPQLQSVINVLKEKLQKQCIPCNDDATKNAAFSTLESIGNIGVMTPEMTEETLKCIENRGVDTNLHIAAIRAFRNAQCQRYATTNLVNIAINPERDTEVRIASYLASIKCVERADVEKMFNVISKEDNSQVRSFILSHLLNIQESSNPDKKHLKYLLNGLAIPNDFGKDFRRDSRNIDISFYEPTLGLGIGMDSNLIYAPGSFFPRSIGLNFSSQFYGQTFNMGEVGARLEGIDEILKSIFDPDIPQNILTEKGNVFVNELLQQFQKRGSIDVNSVAEVLKKFYEEGKSKVPKAEFYANVMGQDIAYKFLKGNMQDVDIKSILHGYTSTFRETLTELVDMNEDYSHMSQMSIDYNLPTVQGTPLRLRFDGTLVYGMKKEGTMNFWNMFSRRSSQESTVKIIPSLSVEFDSFIGYDCFLGKTGMQMNNSLSSNSGMALQMKQNPGEGFEINIDLPENMDMINFESETYLVKVVRGSPEHKIIPPSVHEVRIKKQSCVADMESMFGFKLCYDVDVPDIFQSIGLPFGAQSVVKLHIEKDDPSLQGYKMKVAMQNRQGKNEIKLNIQTKGLASPKRTEVVLSYIKQDTSSRIKLSVAGPGIESDVWIDLRNDENEKELSTYAEYKSNERSFSQGFKLEMHSTPSDEGHDTKFAVYASQSKSFPPESQILSIDVSLKRGFRSADLLMVTKSLNAMTKYMELSSEVALDLTVPSDMNILVPSHLRRFELTLESAGWKLASFLRPEGRSVEPRIYMTGFKLAHASNDIINYEGTHAIQGNMDREFSMKNDLKVKYGTRAFKANCQLFYGRTKTGVEVKIHTINGLQQVDFAVLASQSDLESDFLFLIDAPLIMNSIKFQGSLRGQRQVGHNQLLISLSSGERNAFEISGPVTLRIEPDHHNLEAAVEIKILNHDAYKFSTHLEKTKERLLVRFDLANLHEEIFGIEWKMGEKSLQETHMVFRLDIVSFLKYRCDVILKPRQIDIEIDNILFPMTSQQRRITSSLLLNYDELTSSFTISWERDRDPSKTIAIDSKLIVIPSAHGHYTIDSTVKYANEIYITGLDVNAEYFIHPNYGQNGFRFTLMKPDRKSMTFTIDCKTDRQGSVMKIDSLLFYKNFESREYKLANLVEIDLMRGFGNLKVNSEMKFKKPDQRESKIKTILQTNTDAASQTNHLVKIEADLAGIPKFAVGYSFKIMPLHCTGELTFESPSPFKMISWNGELYAYGRGLKEIEVSTDFTGIAQFLTKLRQIIVGEELSSHTLVAYTDRRAKYHFRFETPSPNKHTLLIRTPERRMELKSEVTHNAINIVFNPDKENTASEYKMNLIFNRIDSHSYTSDINQWHGRLSHPSFIRDKTASLKVTSYGAGVEGKVVIDILPDTADRLMGTVTYSKLSSDSGKMDVSFTARVLKDHPTIKATMAYAVNTLAFDLAFQNTPTSPVTFMMAGKYDNISNSNAAMFFNVKSESQSVLALSAVTRPQQEAKCNGVQIDATVDTPLTERFYVRTDVCQSNYVKISTMHHDGMKEYSASIGLKVPSKAEIGVSVRDKSTHKTDTVSLARVLLASPRMLKLDFNFKSQEMADILDYVKDNAGAVISSVSSWMHMIEKYLMDSATSMHIDFPVPAFVHEWEIIKREASTIIQDIRNKMQSFSSSIMELIHSPQIQYIVKSYTKVWSKMADVHRDSRIALTWKLLDIAQVFEGITTAIGQDVRGFANMMKTAEVPEFIISLRHMLEHSQIYLAAERALENFGQRYPLQYQGLLQTWAKLRAALLEDLEKLRAKFMTIQPVADLVDLTLEKFRADYIANFMSDKIVSRILEETIFVVFIREPNHVGIRLPIRDETQRSLSQFAQQAIPYPTYVLKNIVWSYDTYISKPLWKLLQMIYAPRIKDAAKYLPPFNATAHLVGNTEVLTFDGRMFRIPETSCQVRLATYGNSTLSMQRRLNEHHPTVILKHNSIKAEIKPDFTAFINGQKVNKHFDLLGIGVDVDERAAYIITPYSKIEVLKDSRIITMRISGWRFGKVAGIFGTYDGERENDWFMPTGVIAADVQEFVSSWQEDHNCHTPSLNPIHVPMSRRVECHTLLAIRTRCTPIVNPKPYIKMCQETENPCDAAKAYREQCLSKGVIQPYMMPC